MSQYLVVFYNATPDILQFVNVETASNNQTVQPGCLFRTDQHFNIPDMSDCTEYFSAHHMEVRNNAGQTIFSFWDNDGDSYNLYYCSGINCAKNAYMPGYYNGGNNATVAIFVTGSSASYAIQAYQVVNDV